MRDRLEADPELADLIRHIERERLRALVEVDMEVAEPLHADDFQLITPIGLPLSKAEYLGSVVSGEINYRVFEPDADIAVRLYGDGAVIRYRSRLEIVSDGHHLPLGSYWHTDLYEQHDGRWQIVWSQATNIR